jgi:hypothetical protein
MINNAGIGLLMSNYNKLYAKDVLCTQGVYNSTYNSYYGSLPPAPISFANMSLFTPVAINTTESALTAKNNVEITYSTISSSPDTTGPAVIAIINTSATAFIKSLTYTGIYTGFSYNVLNSTYAFQSKILNNCGAYVSPP